MTIDFHSIECRVEKERRRLLFLKVMKYSLASYETSRDPGVHREILWVLEWGTRWECSSKKIEEAVKELNIPSPDAVEDVVAQEQWRRGTLDLLFPGLYPAYPMSENDAVYDPFLQVSMEVEKLEMENHV